MNLYVVRHGEVEINIKGLLNGRNNVELTENGVNQAIKAGNEIKNVDIELVICSPLVRTKQTCKYININNVPVIYDDRIIERDTKSLMYKKKDSVDLDCFYDPKNSLIYDDCEGVKSILERVAMFIEDVKVKYKGKNILVVTHHDVCKTIYAYINDKINTDDIISFNQSNCEIVKYEINDV